MKISKEQIKKYLGCKAKDLTDAGICPTCFDRATNGSVFGDDSQLKFYEDTDIECLFIANPRADGHMIISTKEHYQDFSDAPDTVNEKIINFSKFLSKAIKQILNVKEYIFAQCVMAQQITIICNFCQDTLTKSEVLKILLNQEKYINLMNKSLIKLKK